MTEQFWGIDIALDLFLGGLGVGTFIFSVLIHHLYGQRLKNVSQVAAYLAPIMVGMGLIFLMLHLGRPDRFYRIFIHFNVTSPLSWGGWLQAIFFGISVLHALMWFTERTGQLTEKLPGWLHDEKKRNVIGMLGVPFAIAVGVYHGFLLMMFNSRPLWNTGPTVVMAICGFIMTGIALVVFVLSVLPSHRDLLDELQQSKRILGATIVAQLFFVCLWLAALFYGPGESHNAMIRLITEFGLLFWGGAVLIGLIMPLIIGGGLFFRNRPGENQSTAIPLISSTMVLLGGFILRYVIIVAAQ